MADNSYTVGGGPPPFFGPQNATDQQAAEVIANTIDAISNAAEFMITGQTATQRGAGLVRAPEPPSKPPGQAVAVGMLPMWLADP